MEFEYQLEHLAEANLMLRTIDAVSDPYFTFRAQAIAGMLGGIRRAVENHNAMLRNFGFESILDSEYEFIAAGMRPKHLPAGEAEVLEASGFADVAGHLSGILYAVRQRAGGSSRRSRELRPSVELQQVAAQIGDAADEHRRLAEIEQEMAAAEGDENRNKSERLAADANRRKKSPRWFKGLGKVVQGTAMSLANIGLAVGVIRFKVTDETRTWGTVVSVTAGVGTILEGVGELRGE
jgi:hypothetical protein